MEHFISDEELSNISIHDANKLHYNDRLRWVQIHNHDSNLYFINHYGDIKEVAPAGWWY